MSNFNTNINKKKKNLEQTEVERNNKICEYYKTGYYSYNTLARMYHVTPQRIQAIVKRAGVRKIQEEVHAE
jgi:Mor family transcriptional regulator